MDTGVYATNNTNLGNVINNEKSIPQISYRRRMTAESNPTTERYSTGTAL